MVEGKEKFRESHESIRDGSVIACYADCSRLLPKDGSGENEGPTAVSNQSFSEGTHGGRAEMPGAAHGGMTT